MALQSPVLLVIAVYLVAAAVLLLAAILWRGQRIRGADLVTTLEAHSDTIARLLDTEEGRHALARFILHENALQAFVMTTEEAVVTAKDPVAAAATEAKKEGGVSAILRRVGNVIKPLAGTLVGKVNSYIKSRFGVSGAV